MSSSRDPSPSASGVRAAPPPQVSCDLCCWPMPVPAHCAKSGEILGLLTCSACLEDMIYAHHMEAVQ